MITNVTNVVTGANIRSSDDIAIIITVVVIIVPIVVAVAATKNMEIADTAFTGQMLLSQLMLLLRWMQMRLN